MKATYLACLVGDLDAANVLKVDLAHLPVSLDGDVLSQLCNERLERIVESKVLFAVVSRRPPLYTG
jgi:hypothetical protein